MKLNFIRLLLLYTIFMGCRVEDIPRVRTSYYNWSGHNLLIKAYSGGTLEHEFYILANTSYSYKDETKARSPLLLVISDSIVVEFEGGKKLIYTDYMSPTRDNLLLIDGYNYFKATDIYNFLYAFTDEHYSKAQ